MSVNFMPGSLRAESPNLSPRATITPISVRATPVTVQATPQLVSTGTMARPVSPRVRARTLISPQTIKTVEKQVLKLVDLKRESNDVNITLDKVMELIHRYGNNSEVHKVLAVHDWKHINKVLNRAAFIFAIRWEIMHLLDVLEHYRHFEHLGEEVKQDRHALVNRLLEQVKEANVEEWLHKLRDYLEQ